MRRHARSGATFLVALSLVAIGCGEKAPSAPIVGSSGAGSAQIALTRRADTVAVDESVQLNAIIPSAPGTVAPAVSWSSSDPNVAIVTQNGVLFALKSGRTTITVTARGYSDATTVTVRPSVREVTFDNDSLTISLAQSVKLPYRVTDSDGNQVDLSAHQVQWVTSDPQTVPLTGDATVTGRSIGAADLLLRVDSKAAVTRVKVMAKPVSKVVVSPTSLAIGVTQNAALIVTSYDVQGNVLTGRSLSWSSSDQTIAYVSQSGVVTGVANGQATVTVNVDGRRTTTVAVTVGAGPTNPSISVASVAVSLNASSLTAGQATQANAITKDVNGNVLTGRTIVWTTSDPAVASADGVGMISALKAGTVTVTATSEGKTGSAPLTVNASPSAPAPVASMTLTVSPTLTVGQSVQAVVSLKDVSGNVLTGRTVNWVSSDATIVSVSASGVVTAVKGGGVTIIASVDEGVSASAVVSAIAPKPAVSSIALSAGTTQLKIGQLTQITAVVRDGSGNLISGVPVTFSASPSTIATVSGSGMTAGVNVGSAMVYAKADTVVRSIGLTVIDTATSISPAPSPSPTVATIVVTLDVASLQVGQTTQAVAVARDSSGNAITNAPITWSSSNTGVVSVSASGLVTGTAAGSTGIVATSGGKTATQNLSVVAPPAPVATVGITISPATLAPAQSVQAVATLRDASGNTLTGRVVAWSSSNTGVASVTAQGLVTALVAGSANVTATSEGKSATLLVSVTAPPPPPPTSTGVLVYPGQSIQAAVDANPAGTAFVLKAGTHVRQSVRPKSGDTFTGEAGTVMDGEGVTVYAFDGYNGAAWVNGVTIKKIAITRYNPPAQMGAIHGGADDRAHSTAGWVLDSLDVHHNANLGVRIGNRMKVLRSNLHHNGTINIGGVGVGILVDGVEVAYGNEGCPNDPGFEAGGSKFAATDSLIVRNSFFHNSCGPGLWLDIDNRWYVLENNRSEDNVREGIKIEISYSGIVRNNAVKGNGWAVDPFRGNGWGWDAGIGIHSSSDVEVYGNTLTENLKGIVATQQNRGSGPYGPYILQNLNVHDNVVYQRTSGYAGAALQDIGDTAIFTSRNNRWVHNTYYLGTNAAPFEYSNGTRNAAAWQGFGNDVTGSFNP